MLDWINTIIDELKDTTQALMFLLVIIIVGAVAFKTRALVPVLGMVLLGAFVLFFTSDAGLDWLPQMIQEETVDT